MENSTVMEIFSTIETFKNVVTNKLVTIASKMEKLRDLITIFDTRIDTLEASTLTNTNDITALDTRVDTLESNSFTSNERIIDLSSQTNTYLWVPTGSFNITLSNSDSLINNKFRNIKCFITSSSWESLVNNSGTIPQNMEIFTDNNAGIVYFDENDDSWFTLPYVIVERHGTPSTASRVQLDITFYKKSDILYTNIIAHYMESI